MSVPKLRFPEFLDAGEWEEKKLDNIGEFTGGGTPSKSNGDYWDGNIPWISSSDVSDESIYQVNISRFITEEALKQSATKIVPANSILLVSRVGVGKLAITEKPVCTSQDFTNFTPAKDNLIFLAYLLRSNKNNLISLNQGTSIRGFTKEDISNFTVSLPCIKEQQKIADCLSSLDDRITLETQKLDTLKAHKKGLMHQLFPAEGETLPKLRFPEFRDSREWVEKAISEIIPPSDKYAIVDGPFGSNLKTIHYQSEGVPIITSGYVTDGFFNVDKYLYVSQEKFEKEKRSAVRGGDIVMAKIGARCGASAIIPNSHEVGILSGNALKITIDKSRFITSFIWQILWGLHTNQSLNVLISVGAQPAISLVNLKKYKLTLPTKKEQKKIADCLASIDEAIAAQSQAIDLLKLHKKGLMQQLFPFVEEVKR